MTRVRFVALGDSLTEGVGDPLGDGWRGWAALLAAGLAEEPAEVTNLALGGAQTRDVAQRQLPAPLALRPDVVSVVVGVNNTLRRAFDLGAARLDTVYAAFTEQGALLLTACLPDPGAMPGPAGAPARSPVRRQRVVNAVMHALSDRYGAVHLHACEGDSITDRAIRTARYGARTGCTPASGGHRQLAPRFHALLAASGDATGPAPSPENDVPAPTRSASLWRPATAGTGWAARRCADLLPSLLTLAADEPRHHARGTSARLDLRTSAAVSAALAALSTTKRPEAA
ncbi:GDSL-type esterase/lipase family protein [Streptomyces sp. NPDC000351]|uniref:GDSL-type esterase/lipase family protein n=1 Tax=Streptomyces sp. NPDC000351 TaxID=3154250 RepID=UPI00332D1780